MLEQLRIVGNYHSTGKKQKGGSDFTAIMNNSMSVLHLKGKHWAMALHPVLWQTLKKTPQECLKDAHYGYLQNNSPEVVNTH